MPRTLIVDPTAPCLNQPQQLGRTLDGLTGKVVGFIDDSKPNFNHLVDDLAELLVNRYGASKVIKRRKRVSSHPASDTVITELVEQCDMVITGSGD
ncbi:MAG: hypothetical protein A3G24_12355 [Betaproteobacteria bacterium RIFCSPLOWO2_12_FULL_62_13]|nr:MAG: hypothetical protein A3G24_12355 [Betaproteobacteria bacterium RIFCSPLOWO2_12_FULL_62_13]